MTTPLRQHGFYDLFSREQYEVKGHFDATSFEFFLNLPPHRIASNCV
jgi:hypothetical protein